MQQTSPPQPFSTSEALSMIYRALTLLNTNSLPSLRLDNRHIVPATPLQTPVLVLKTGVKMIDTWSKYLKSKNIYIFKGSKWYKKHR